MSARTRRFGAREFDDAQRRPGVLVGITLTDRCPVGCAHCSVSATIDDRGPETESRFLDHVRALATDTAFEVVLVTGGEPFTHPATLARACRTLVESGKRVVVHTSGYWGDTRRAERDDVQDVLSCVDALVLGVDLYHRPTIDDARLVDALRRAAECGAWLVLQTITGEPGADHEAYAQAIAARAFGERWRDHAEIVRNPPLPVGRAQDLESFTAADSHAGFCDLVRRPMLRFDGEVLACCNEPVIRGQGPAALRRRVEGNEVARAFEELAQAPLVELVRRLPTGVVLELVECVDGRRDAPPRSKCDACFRAGERIEALDEDQRLRLGLLARMALAAAAPAIET